MRILVVGAGRIGAYVLRQLRKNSRLQVCTVDPREHPFAVTQGVIPKVDYHEPLTSHELLTVIDQVKPDLILVTTASEDLITNTRHVSGMSILVEALRKELAARASVPVIAVARM
ncbi:MAG: hypothetical protein JSV76_06335 [Candidatus Bathyarchaeota archaeon]|nr:MAG: hypothetical protein JSV76_06335 [Candidatus Bathyarchaeota archaeon]